jgi:hypothetical protein
VGSIFFVRKNLKNIWFFAHLFVSLQLNTNLNLNNRLMKKILLTFVLTMSVMGAWADDVTFSPLQYEALPDLKTPRRGHVCIATANGDVVVTGGHTTDFALTTTAERFHDGQWEYVDIAHAHDGAAYVTLSDGRVLICGGMSSGYGVGQSKACDIYDPATNSFTTAASMTIDRAFCAGVATGDGNNVLVSGNWYNSDTTFDLWDGTTWTSFGTKEVELNNPLMVSAGDGIVYVFGCFGNYGGTNPATVWKVDTKNLTAETVADTGLEGYQPIHGDYNPVKSLYGDRFFIAKKDTKMLLMEFDAATAKAKELAELSSKTPEEYSINYTSGVLFNPDRKEAYVIGAYGGTQNKGLVVVNYNYETQKMAAYYASGFVGYPYWGVWALQPVTGKIVFTGGSLSDNFDAVGMSLIVTPFGDGDAGISSVTLSKQKDNKYYTIDGRKLDKAPTAKGVYVVNGKKVIVK